MQAISEVVNTYNKKTIDNSIKNNLNNSINNSITKLDNRDIDFLLKEYADLHLPKDNGWHAQMIRIIGAQRYEVIAHTARAEGRMPARYFTWLLNRELGL